MKIKWNIFKQEHKYVVIFCVKEANTYNFISEHIIKANAKTIRYDKDNLFNIDIENPSYRKRNLSCYCIDINSKQIYFRDLKNKEIVSSRVNKMIMQDQIIMQLAKATTTPIKQTYDWKSLLIGGIIGLLIGFIIKIFVPI